MALPDSITIFSGGQTGADRAALDFAIEHGIPHGGWCPKGRLAEDGALAREYQLTETPSRRYALRTEWNIRDSDATVVFSTSPDLGRGTRLTLAIARRFGKPCLHLTKDVSSVEGAACQLRKFIAEHAVECLNVAGPRASQQPGVGLFVHQVLRAAFAHDAAQAARHE